MTTDTSAEALEESIFWLKAKYRRHGEIEDRIAAEQLEYFQAEKRRVRRSETAMNKNEKLNLYLDTLSTSERGVAERALALAASVYPEQERAMNKQFTANDVRRLSNRIPRSNDEIADAQEALRAFADMLEAREKAVPVAECGHSSTVEHRASNANVTGSSPAARSNSDADRLAEALRQIAVTTKGYPNASREGEIAIKALAAHSAQAQPPYELDPAITEKWENGELGRSLEYAQVAQQPAASVTDAMVNAALLAYNVECHSQGDATNARADGMRAALGAALAAQENPNGL